MIRALFMEVIPAVSLTLGCAVVIMAFAILLPLIRMAIGL